MSKPFIGLIGIGYWGKNLYRDLHSLHVLHTACEANPEIRARYQQEMKDHPNVVADYQQILQNPSITAVVIALPAEMHYDYAKRALLANKDVFVEKPLALKLHHAQELVALAKERQKILMVGHVMRYHPCIEKLLEIVHNNSLGKIQYVNTTRKNLGKIRQAENVLWSFAPHDISIVQAIMQATPLKIQCIGQKHLHPDIHDVTDTYIEYPGNCHAHISVNWLYPIKEQKVTVVGTKGMLIFDDREPQGRKLKICSEYLQHTPGCVPCAKKLCFEYVDVDWTDSASPLTRECAHFVECCLTRKNPLTDGEEGLSVLRVLDQCQKILTIAKEDSFERERKYYAHESSVIESNAKIGDGCKIWHFAHVMNAQIGRDCSIGQNCFIGNNAVLGDNCRVQNNVSVYDGVVCGNNVFLGPSMVFCNDMNPRASVSKNGKYLQTIVQDGVSIGANATILPGITLGAHCFIGAGAVVLKDVEPYAVMVGNPARRVGSMDESGTIRKD